MRQNIAILKKLVHHGRLLYTCSVVLQQKCDNATLIIFISITIYYYYCANFDELWPTNPWDQVSSVIKVELSAAGVHPVGMISSHASVYSISFLYLLESFFFVYAMTISTVWHLISVCHTVWTVNLQDTCHVFVTYKTCAFFKQCKSMTFYHIQVASLLKILTVFSLALKAYTVIIGLQRWLNNSCYIVFVALSIRSQSRAFKVKRENKTETNKLTAKKCLKTIRMHL